MPSFFKSINNREEQDWDKTCSSWGEYMCWKMFIDVDWHSQNSDWGISGESKELEFNKIKILRKKQMADLQLRDGWAMVQPVLQWESKSIDLNPIRSPLISFSDLLKQKQCLYMGMSRLGKAIWYWSHYTVFIMIILNCNQEAQAKQILEKGSWYV